MHVEATPLPKLLLIKPKIYTDERGYFYESHHHKRYQQHGIPKFVQDNISKSSQDTLRGLHFQQPNTQGKLVSVLSGAVWDVAVDLRKNSTTFGKWFAITLSSDNHYQLYIPEGFAHGFCVLSAEAIFNYKCTAYYSPDDEQGIVWNDPDLNIPWPIHHPILSKKDQNRSRLKDLSPQLLFK